MFDFWDFGTTILKGGLSSFLGGGNKGSNYTDNSNFSTSDTKRNIPKAGKSKAPDIVEGSSQFNVGGGASAPKWNGIDSDWGGKPFKNQLSKFLEGYDETDDEKRMN